MADKETLSAFMDGHIDDAALLDELELNDDEQQAWQHYHLIGDVMRGEVSEQLSTDWNIADKVASALENEPEHHVVLSAPLLVESQPTPSKAKRHLPAWLTQFGQVAVAACVSFAVIVGVQQYGGTNTGLPAADSSQLPVLQTIPLSGSAEPVSLTRQSFNKEAHNANVQEQHKRVMAMLQDYDLQLRLNSRTSATDDTLQKSDVE